MGNAIGKKAIYKGEKRGVLLSVLSGEAAELSCNGEALVQLSEKTADFKTEKHVPVITAEGSGVKVVVGSTPHPMTAEHYVMWIEVIDGAYVYRKYLQPGEAAEAVFNIPYSENLIAREYCNLHGLWEK